MSMHAVIAALTRAGIPSKQAQWLAEKSRRELFATAGFSAGAPVIWCVADVFTLSKLS